MRTMASVLFSVIVLITINEVFGNDAVGKIKSCDDCIRSGGNWCNKHDEERRCVQDMEDSWCDGGREIFQNRQFNTSGKLVNPQYAERTLIINSAGLLDIQYPGPTVQKPNILIINSTQSTNLKIEVVDNKCPSTECTMTIKAIPTSDFCSSDGQPGEYIFVTLQIASFEVVVVRYNVDCGCPCSLNVIPKAVVCHKHGDYACGTCSCYTGWSGQYCDQAQCENKRGDIQCAHPLKSTVECSGNGHCGPCDTCICDTDAVGAQYFNEEYYCEDICLRILTNDCETCFNVTNSTFCSKCGISFQEYNEEISLHKDIENRSIWVPCSIVVDECDINYVTKIDANGALQVMIVNSCNDIQAGAIVSDSKVPLILGLLAGVAAIAAVAGVMIWKHMNAVPPLPLNDPQYTNIGAEDCTGENPLYKPPTSSFKNPTYGKW